MVLKTRQLKLAFLAVDVILVAVALLFLWNAGSHLFASQEPAPSPLSTPLPDSGVNNNSSFRPVRAVARDYSNLSKSNLFGAISTTNITPQKVEEELPETTLELVLKGCVATGDPETSFAIIQDKKSRSEDTYAVGDFIAANARVEEIRDFEVVITHKGRREVLAMTFSVEQAPARAANPFSGLGRSGFPTRPRRRSAGSSDEAIRVVNDNLRYINREKLMEEVSQNIGSVLNQFRTSPNTVDGKQAGIQIDAVGSDPLSSKAGIKPGDVVKSVNGVRINAFDDIMGLGDRLQNAPEVRVVIERDGRHRTLVYKIR